MILKLKNTSKNFYLHMGPYFGSRKVEKVTHDRMFDDDNKEWWILFDKKHAVMSFVSISNNKIKNIYGEKAEFTVDILKKVFELVTSSIVPSCYEEQYEEAGYTIVAEKTKQFLLVKGGKNE